QAWIWSGGYAVYIVLCAVVALLDRRLPEAAPSAAAAADDAPDAPAPTLRDYALWTTLAALGSILLLGVSNHLTQDVASIPLLWVVPLSIYLATFIICFEREGWYRPVPFAIAAAAAVVAMAAGLSFGALRHVLWLQLAVFCGGLFVACMACHGELARLKPTGRHLTGFYLTIALGGAIGAALVGIGAPLALPDHFEIEIGIAALSLLLFLRMRTSTPLVRASLLVALVATCFATVMHIQNLRTTTIVLTRNFYGVLRVMDGESEGARQRWIVHGAIVHGRQWLDPARRREPAGYYRKESGGGRALLSLEGAAPRRVGVVGLGAGALAAYGRAGDTYRLYEINPAVITMARRDFTYLADSAATIETVLGDARLQLEREAPQRYDILIIDAFSGDSVPMHLVTREALRLYRRHVVDGGIVAFHISNKFLDLAPALREIALDAKLAVGMVRDRDAAGMPVSDWVLMAPDRSAFEKAPLAGAVTEIRARPELGVWTDDFNTIVRILR
ncbi:MAG: fused MFS/spermidine synthase, partial [Rhodospirillales bacterium]|nr:fused MFS/spermidine synthase [Rhodospirillales bacterium]